VGLMTKSEGPLRGWPCHEVAPLPDPPRQLDELPKPAPAATIPRPCAWKIGKIGTLTIYFPFLPVRLVLLRPATGQGADANAHLPLQAGQGSIFARGPAGRVQCRSRASVASYSLPACPGGASHHDHD